MYRKFLWSARACVRRIVLAVMYLLFTYPLPSPVLAGAELERPDHLVFDIPDD